MPFTDSHAAERLVELREAAGLSPEHLAKEITAMAKSAGWTKGAVDAYTIRRIEKDPYPVPTVRVQFVIAHYFGLAPHELWQPRYRKLRIKEATAA